MSAAKLSSRLDRPVREEYDHILGPAGAQITLVEYGSYACPYCRAANEQIAEVRDRFGDRLRYVFRHRPLTGSDIARRAAELAERADGPEHFWNAHVKLMTRSETLTEDDLSRRRRRPEPRRARIAAGRPRRPPRRAKARVDADERQRTRQRRACSRRPSSSTAAATTAPGTRARSSDAMLGTLGHRVRSAALDFASWGPSAGVLLLLATVLAIVLTNSPLGAGVRTRSGSMELGFTFGDAGFRMSLRHWINDGLLTIFFLVVGLEIKREFTVGHLASRRSAALPVAAAIGGMAVPALLYLLIVPQGPWAHGWGVPMATDTAFAVALIVMMGRAVPVELRIFLTAAAIVDDIGAIIVVALFYSGELHLGFLAAAAVSGGALALLNRSARLPRRALPAARRRALGLRPCQRPARDAGRRGPGAVHPDPAARQPEGAGDAGQHAHRGRGAARRRGAAPRSLAAGVAGARRDPRSPGIAGRPAAAARRRALELRGPAAVRPGQCRRRRRDGRGGRPRASDARDHRRTGRSASRSASSPPARSRCGSASPSSRPPIRGASWPALAHWPASASRCRCSSPARRSRPQPISPPPRLRCSPPRSCQR